MKREVIQICSDSNKYGQSLYALCSDGSIWYKEGVHGWYEIEDIPTKSNVDSGERVNAK